MIATNALVGAPNVYPLDLRPMQPTASSLAWAVMAVVPVLAAVLLEALLLLAVASSGLALKTPEYSTITAAAKTPADKLIVTLVPAPASTGAYQISLVVEIDGVDCAARVQAKDVPLLDIPVTAPALALRVEIAATSVLPGVGAVTLTTNELAALAPVLPVAGLPTRAGVT